MNASINFKTMDLGTGKPTSVKMETVEVVVSPEGLMRDYSKAFVREAYRKDPRRAEQVGLTEDEVFEYAKFLLRKRVECVNDTCTDYRKLKALYIPVYIQYNLAMIGEVIDRDYGLQFTPVMDDCEVITLKEAFAISEKIGSFEYDLQMVQDAMPRSPEGDKDVMSTALIAGYVRAYQKVEHPASTYVTAFLDMKLREEAAFQILYRVQYDDVDFIATALTTQKGLF